MKRPAKHRGRVWRFGDEIDTDQIFPGKYLPLTDKKEMARHAMEGVPGSENFRRAVREGDIIVAGKNFGSGSSREHAAVAIRGAGIRLIIAESFARIFYRNCINMGLSVLELYEAGEIAEGDVLRVDADYGTILDETSGRRYAARPLSGLEMEIMHAGGLLKYLERRNRRHES